MWKDGGRTGGLHAKRERAWDRHKTATFGDDYPYMEVLVLASLLSFVHHDLQSLDSQRALV